MPFGVEKVDQKFAFPAMDVCVRFSKANHRKNGTAFFENSVASVSAFAEVLFVITI